MTLSLAAVVVAAGLGVYGGVNAGQVALVVIESLCQLVVVIIIGGLIAAQFKRRDRERARQEAVLKAQSELLDAIAGTILTYETLASDVTWFKDAQARNEEMHEKQFRRYNERLVDIVSRWRALAAKSQTLVSPDVSKKITAFLDRAFREQDTPMMQLYREQAGDAAWRQQHLKNVSMIREANQLIAEIAIDMKMSRDALER